jgi:3-deoxy-7-phosphoheptulonate synthase
MNTVPPQILQLEQPLSQAAKATISAARRDAAAILNDNDDRLLVVVGPCSIHDVDAALEYGISISYISLYIFFLISYLRI